MTRTGQAAVDYAVAHLTSGYSGLCLKGVRTALDVPAKYASAHDAWANAKHRHFTSDPDGIPVGVPIFMGDNHVALSAGGGRMWTTNSATNKPEVTTISSWARSYPLKGWAEDLNGVTVYTASGPAPRPTPKPAPPPPTTPVILGPGARSAAVGRLQAGLKRVFPAYRSAVTVKRGQLIAVDDRYGDQTTAWVKVFQQRTGLPATGKVDTATQAKLAHFGIAL